MGICWCYEEGKVLSCERRDRGEQEFCDECRYPVDSAWRFVWSKVDMYDDSCTLDLGLDEVDFDDLKVEMKRVARKLLKN